MKPRPECAWTLCGVACDQKHLFRYFPRACQCKQISVLPAYVGSGMNSNELGTLFMRAIRWCYCLPVEGVEYKPRQKTIPSSRKGGMTQIISKKNLAVKLYAPFAVTLYQVITLLYRYKRPLWLPFWNQQGIVTQGIGGTLLERRVE